AVDLIEDVGSCFVNCDRSRYIDFFDFLCFQTRFAVGDPYADCDATGVLDWFDFLCFVNEFALGECGP
ncbi:MAG: GC-type dockerin domain-anchored protein, partial [Phycisphaerales bacterium JB039]